MTGLSIRLQRGHGDVPFLRKAHAFHRIHGLHLLYVRSCHEGLVALARDDDDPHRVIAAQFAHCAEEVVQGGGIERVERVGPVDLDEAYLPPCTSRLMFS